MKRGLVWMLPLVILGWLLLDPRDLGAWYRSTDRFYLTIERSYGTSEAAELRLDFTNARVPILLRILKPESVEGFLDGQLQISRSYEEPLSAINPGHYLWRGINEVRSPLPLLRGMLGVDFRRAFGGAMGPIHGMPADLAAVPPEIMHQGPAHFSIVREFYIDLQRGGEKPNDFGWWFSGKGWEENSFKMRRVMLAPLPEGIYLVQGVQGDYEGQALLQVSDLAVQAKQSSQQLLVRVMNRSLASVEGASLSYRDGRGKWIAVPGKSNAGGELLFESPEGNLDGKLVLKVLSPDGKSALLDTDFMATPVEQETVFIMTDRPLFKPGDRFSFKGTVRKTHGGRLVLPGSAESGVEADISLVNSADGRERSIGKAIVNGFGTFSGSVDLKDDEDPGLYKLRATLGSEPYSGELRVRDYVKPTFYLELLSTEGALRPGQLFKFRMRAKKYSGAAPQGVRYELFVYRKKFEIPAFVMDAGQGLSAGSDYFGASRSVSSLAQPQRLFSSVDERLKNNPDAESWSSAPRFDDKGEAEATIAMPAVSSDKGDEEWIYTLSVRALAFDGSSAVLSENYYQTLSEAVASVAFGKVIAEANGEGVRLGILASKPDGSAYAGARGYAQLRFESARGELQDRPPAPFVANQNGQAEILVLPGSESGRLEAVAVLTGNEGRTFDREARSGAAQLLVGEMNGAAIVPSTEVELYANSTIMSPGEASKLYVILPQGWGQGERGTVWRSTAGDRIHSTSHSLVMGRSHVYDVIAKPEFGTGFYETVTIGSGNGRYREQTIGFRVVPAEKKLGLSIVPSAEIAEPLKPFGLEIMARDWRGAPAAGVEVALSVVDRAVYALQPEFGPGIFDFFYPLTRLNLMTFYSDELQGYGYSDLIRKPNFKLSALKTQAKPSKRTQRDTAGWFPHLVTGADGRVRVDVEMPSNLTEWLVAAVAADREGRLGEAKGSFRSATDIGIEARLPQYLRRGDRAIGAVEITNQSSSPARLQLTAAVSGGAVLKSAPSLGEVELHERGAHSEPIEIAAASESGIAEVQVEPKVIEGLKVGGARVFDIALKSAAFEQLLSAKNDGPQKDVVRFWPAAQARPRKLEVRVSRGLLGASLGAARALVSYPFGCTEQLVHSALPNFVLIDLLRRAGYSESSMGPYKDVFEKARTYAKIGIEKLSANQRRDGSFGLWPNDNEGSVSITLVALAALKAAGEAGLKEAEPLASKAEQFLSSDTARRPTLTPYELQLFLSAPYYARPDNAQLELVRKTLQDESVSLEELVAGLRIVIANESIRWSRFNQNIADSQARDKLAGRLASRLENLDLTVFQPELLFSDRLPGFPARGTLLVSDALGALFAAKQLTPALRGKLVRHLLDAQEAGSWGSTFDDASVIFNLREFLGEEAAQAKEAPSALRGLVGGGKVIELEAVPGGFFGECTLDDIDIGRDSPLALVIEALPAEARVQASLRVNIPAGSVTAAANGIRIVRRFFRGAAKRPREVGDLSSLKVGDVVVSEVSVTRERPKAVKGYLESDFVVVTDPVPSIAETVEDDGPFLADAGLAPEDETYRTSLKQTLRYSEKTVRVLDLKPEASFKLYNVWRVGYAGEALLPPAEAFDMYDSTIRANDLPLRVFAR